MKTSEFPNNNSPLPEKPSYTLYIYAGCLVLPSSRVVLTSSFWADHPPVDASLSCTRFDLDIL